MADIVSDVSEKVLGTPEKEVVEKKVVEEVQDIDDEDSKPSENGNTNGSDDVKENGSLENGDAPEENGDGDGPKNGVEKDCEVIASKRKSAGGDAPDSLIAEGASPEKKAKLEDPVEVEANGDAEVVA